MSVRTIAAASMAAAVLFSAVPSAFAGGNVVSVDSQGSNNKQWVEMLGHNSRLKATALGSRIRQDVTVSDRTDVTVASVGANSKADVVVVEDGARHFVVAGPGSTGEPTFIGRDGYYVHVLPIQ